MERERCMRCGADMVNMGQENIQLGKMGFLTGVWSNLFSGAISVDIYCCKVCKKLEFYAMEPADDEYKIAQAACPYCGQLHEIDDPKCPHCGTRLMK